MNMNLTEKQTDILIKAGLYFIAFVSFLIIINKISKAILGGGTQQYEDQLNSNNLSFSEYQYKQWADSLFIAFNGWGTDEQATYRILNYLQNIDDWLKLIVVYGKDDDDMRLPERLIYELDKSEQGKVNQILSKFGASI